MSPIHRPEHSTNSPLSIHAMTVAYDRKPVLWDVDYDAPEDPQLIAIVGPNGAGKSTLIKACLGLVPRASGLVAFRGKPLDAVVRPSGTSHNERVWIGNFRSPRSMSCAWVDIANWVVPSEFDSKTETRALVCLDRVGLADLADRQIRQLSGGQQQRVFLARALAQEADLYFMDEPFAGVDAATEQAILGVLREMKNEGRTIIVVHHDLQTVPTSFDEVIFLNMRVVDSGPVAEVFHEDNLRKTYGGRLTMLAEAAEAVARYGAS